MLDIRVEKVTFKNTPPPPFSPSLISLMVSVTIKHHVYYLTPLLPYCHLKTTHKSAKFENLEPFVFFFALACENSK